MEMERDFTFTSESVTEGHPDKICDQISDVVLDACLKQDQNSRVACECMIKALDKRGFVILSGEITSSANFDFHMLVKNVVKDIGYDCFDKGLDYEEIELTELMGKQSKDIAQGVDSKEQGAGDQGMMFGYANRDTEEFMPMPIMLANNLTKRLSEARKNRDLKFLRPDGKSQVTVKYEDSVPVSVEHITIAAQHDDICMKEVREGIIEEVIKKTIPKYLLSEKKIADISCINGTGKFITGGPEGDTGLTGRKIIVDTYGGFARHGGGAFSGKDPSKVDRSASYMARHIAKNIIVAGLADDCEVQLAYSIGVAEPDNININTFGTGQLPDDLLEKKVRKFFPLKPKEIIDYLKLKNPIYLPTASYGHFGRGFYEEEKKGFFSWEKIIDMNDFFKI